MTVLDELRQLVEDDRRFREEAFERASAIFAEIRGNLDRIVKGLGAGDATYPVEIDQQNPEHLVVLLGPRAVHIVLQPSVGVRKELVYADENTMRPLFQEIAAAPDHAHPAEHSVAIDFIRGSAQAFRLQAPGEALIFAAVHVAPEECVVETKFGSKAFPRAAASTWMPDVLASLLAQSLAWGISVWPGARTIDYRAVLETRLVGLPSPRGSVRERRIGFEPPRTGDELVKPGVTPGSGDGT